MFTKISIFALPFLFLQACSSQAQPFVLAVDAFEKGIATPEIQLLDVRTAEEYEAGHLANALQEDSKFLDSVSYKTNDKIIRNYKQFG